MKRQFQPSEEQIDLIAIEKWLEKEIKQYGIEPFELSNPYGSFIALPNILTMHVDLNLIKIFFKNLGKMDKVKKIERLQKIIYILGFTSTTNGNYRVEFVFKTSIKKMDFMLELGQAEYCEDKEVWYSIFLEKVDELGYQEKAEEIRLKSIFLGGEASDIMRLMINHITIDFQKEKKIITKEFSELIEEIIQQTKEKINEFNQKWSPKLNYTN